MGLNQQVKNLIQYVADNDLQKAKQSISVIIANEKSQSNQAFCRLIRSKLQTSDANLIELPPDIRPLLKMEDVSVSFNENRYLLTDREQAVFEQINSVHTVNRQLAGMGVKYLNSTLLYGESGTGKTTFGRYVAHQLGVPFAYLNFANCISSYLGSTAKNIEKVFDHVKQQKCVLMLDEVDAIGLRRGKEDVGEMSRVVIGLMQALDLLENDIVVIGATNRKDMIDEALIRRFSIKHEIVPLNQSEVARLIAMFLDDVGISYHPLDIQAYAANHNKQSEIIRDLTLALVSMLIEQSEFCLNSTSNKKGGNA